MAGSCISIGCVFDDSAFARPEAKLCFRVALLVGEDELLLARMLFMFISPCIGPQNVLLE